MSNLKILFLLFFNLLFITLSLLLVFFLFSPASLKSYLTGSPLVPTPKKEIRSCLKAVNLSPDETLLDLGSGTGRVLIIANKEFGAKVRGIEHSKITALISKINLILRGVSGEIVSGDFLNEDFSEADVVFTYLSTTLLKKIYRKIKEKDRNITIVSYCFPVPGVEETKKTESERGKSIYVYKLKTN